MTSSSGRSSSSENGSIRDKLPRSNNNRPGDASSARKRDADTIPRSLNNLLSARRFLVLAVLGNDKCQGVYNDAGFFHYHSYVHLRREGIVLLGWPGFWREFCFAGISWGVFFFFIFLLIYFSPIFISYVFLIFLFPSFFLPPFHILLYCFPLYLYS